MEGPSIRTGRIISVNVPHADFLHGFMVLCASDGLLRTLMLRWRGCGETVAWISPLLYGTGSSISGPEDLPLYESFLCFQREQDLRLSTVHRSMFTLWRCFSFRPDSTDPPVIHDAPETSVPSDFRPANLVFFFSPPYGSVPVSPYRPHPRSANRIISHL